jgi:hypothetical protein
LKKKVEKEAEAAKKAVVKKEDAVTAPSSVVGGPPENSQEAILLYSNGALAQLTHTKLKQMCEVCELPPGSSKPICLKRLAEWIEKKLNGLTHTKLKNMCDERQLKPGSTKDICVKRLMGGDDKSATAKAAPGADGAGAKRDGEGAGGDSKAKKQKGGADAKSSNSKAAGEAREPATKKQRRGGGGAGRAGAGAGAGAGGAPQRMLGQLEPAVNILPTTRWEDLVPVRSCSEELRQNPEIRAKVRIVDSIANDVDLKVLELPYADPPLPVKLPDNELYAIVAYTHDCGSERESNLYYQLNTQLRERGVAERQSMVRSWGPFVHFALKGMARLPDYKGIVWRGFPDKETTLRQYSVGRPIQWGAFTSTSTNFDATKGFTNKATGVIFKITVLSGKDINAYSFFPCEGEILLSPSHRFIVSSEPYELDGYTVVDMVQQNGSAWVS